MNREDTIGQLQPGAIRIEEAATSAKLGCVRDPLYNAIVQGLNCVSDGNAFERCAAALLRGVYPTLVPMPGGNDAGWDGRAAEDGNVLQLVCTIRQDVIGNVTGSIQQSLAKADRSSGVIVATARQLTNEQRRNLRERVESMGKRLVEIYDQPAIADLIYVDRRWRKELLGLSGNPPALSAMPANLRPSPPMSVIGRDDELAALKTGGNKLLVGQPGSGKTHLLRKLANEEGGLFLVSNDIEAIADGVRSQRPRVIVVDDAGSSPGQIASLRQFASDTGAEFRIVAACWPGLEDMVARELSIDAATGINLPPLTQKEIKQIIDAMRIAGPPELVKEILDQAGGKPGLAVTLCQLCWEDGVQQVILGDALARNVRSSLSRMANEQAISVLAYIALGGSRGLTIEQLEELTKLPGIVVRDLAVRMGAAGVLEIGGDQRMSVQPVRLRQALVRDVFLKPPALSWIPCAELASRSAVVESVIGGGLVGGEIDDAVVQDQIAKLREHELPDVLCAYAHLGRMQSNWVLKLFPQHAEHCSEPLLEHNADTTLQVLLIAADLKLPVHNDREALKPIRVWVHAVGNTMETVPRRAKLLEALETCRSALTNEATVVHAVRIALELHFEWITSPPAQPATITFSHGCVPVGALKPVAALWSRVVPMISELGDPAASDVANAFHSWIFPRYLTSMSVPEEYEPLAKQLARRMITQAWEVYTGRWAVQRSLHDYARRAGVEPGSPAALPDVLYPEERLEEDIQNQPGQRAAADFLALEWLAEGPTKRLIEAWTRIDREAEAAKINYPEWGRHIASVIAAAAPDPSRWFEALVEADARPVVVEPFAFRLCRESREFLEGIVSRFSAHTRYPVLAFEAMLRYATPDGGLWKSHESRLGEFIRLIEFLVLRNELSEDAVSSLLQHADSRVRAAAAARRWSASDKSPIPDAQFPIWRKAIIETVDDEHELPAIATRHPDIAFEWLLARLSGNVTKLWRAFTRRNEFLTPVFRALTREHRRALIRAYHNDFFKDGVLADVIDGNLELLAEALRAPNARNAALASLQLNGAPNDEWYRRAIVCLDADITAESVFGASHYSEGWTGSHANFMEECRLKYAPMLEHADPRIREVGRIGTEYFSKQRDRARTRERSAAVRGRLA